MNSKPYLIIDFDSTFVKLESLDELAKIALRNKKNKTEIIQEIEAITRQGMEGKIPFNKSLSERIKLFMATKNDIKELVNILKENITFSFEKNKSFLKKNADNIFIISGGFKEYILPVVKNFGIKEKNILANCFVFDNKGRITGYNKRNLLSKNNGKTKAVRSLNLGNEIIVIGDGYTDYKIKEQKAADKFYAFTENIKRENVVTKADYELENLDALLVLLN